MYSVEDMVAYVAIVREGSVTGAAQSLQLDPATVSRRLSKLESKLQVCLIERNTRRMSITAEGRLFHAHASRVVSDLQSLDQRLRKGELFHPAAPVVAAPNWLLESLVLPAVARMGEESRLNVHSLDNGPGMQLPTYTVAPLSQVKGLHLDGAPVCADRPVLCASRDYIARNGLPTDGRALRTSRRVMDTSETVWHMRDGAQIGFDEQVLLCEDTAVRMMLIRGGAGIGAVSMVQARDELHNGELVEVLPGQLNATNDDLVLAVEPRAAANNEQVAVTGQRLHEALRQVVSRAAIA